MAAVLLAGTRGGVYRVEDARTLDLGGPVSALAASTDVWAVSGDHRVHLSRDGLRWEVVADLPAFAIRCLLPSRAETYLGTSEAHLYRLRGEHAERIEQFEDVEGRDAWHTPWGGPPDTRSLSLATDGTVYANVHVGGIPKSTDGEGSWTPTIDIQADVHQVLAAEDLVLAACAPGLAVSSDAGATWRIDAEGLHGSYCRAVAVGGDTVFVSASTGPFSKEAAVYRRPVRSDASFEKCAGGLPEWFGPNIDTHCLVAQGDRVALGTQEGEIWVSGDRGTRWEAAADGLPGMTSLCFSPGDGG